MSESNTIREVHLTLGGISTPVMEGDNLAIVICSAFDNPDEPIDEELGWGVSALCAYGEIEAAIHDHYEPVIKKLEESNQTLKSANQAHRDNSYALVRAGYFVRLHLLKCEQLLREKGIAVPAYPPRHHD